MHPRRRLMLRALSLGIVGHATAGLGQVRPGQPAVVEPPPPPPALPAPDFAREFRGQYRAAGMPRIILYWDIELSDRTHADVLVREHVASSGSKTATSTRAGNASDPAASRDTTVQTQAQSQRETTVGEQEDPKRATALSPRDSSQFQRAFDAEMRNGGVLLVDRAMALRAASIDKAATAESRKRLEAEALRARADLLLQVLFVADNAAPTGYGFDVSVRSVSTGATLVSFYTIALPPPPPVRGGYVAGDRGFQFQTAPAPSPGLDDVAVELAREVMMRLGPVLPSRTGSARGPAQP